MRTLIARDVANVGVRVLEWERRKRIRTLESYERALSTCKTEVRTHVKERCEKRCEVSSVYVCCVRAQRASKKWGMREHFCAKFFEFGSKCAKYRCLSPNLGANVRNLDARANVRNFSDPKIHTTHPCRKAYVHHKGFGSV